MKRYGNLFDKVISIENLRLADERARKGKRHSYGVRLHDRNREANLQALHEQLKNGTFKTSAYSTFKIHEPKERTIYRLPYYPDRIVHHAIMNVLEPIWLSVFTADTYSCIKGRGIHAAARKLRKTLDKDRDGCKYCMKIDIKKFYPSVDHGVMKTIVRKKIKDARLLHLLDGIIDSAPGLPIGNYLSQYLANLVLTYFDHWAKEVKGVRHYFRYADDIVVLNSDKAKLRALLSDFTKRLADTVKLKVKDNKQIFPVAVHHGDRHGRGIDFLGFVTFLNETRLRKRIKSHFCKALSKFAKGGTDAESLKHAFASWLGWCKFCDSKNLINKLIKTFKYYENEFRHSPGRYFGFGQRCVSL